MWYRRSKLHICQCFSRINSLLLPRSIPRTHTHTQLCARVHRRTRCRRRSPCRSSPRSALRCVRCLRSFAFVAFRSRCSGVRAFTCSNRNRVSTCVCLFVCSFCAFDAQTLNIGGLALSTPSMSPLASSVGMWMPRVRKFVAFLRRNHQFAPTNVVYSAIADDDTGSVAERVAARVVVGNRRASRRRLAWCRLCRYDNRD
jgi:hypothetical protein